MRIQTRSWTNIFTKLGIRQKKRSSSYLNGNRRKLRFEQFEDRRMLAAFTVNVAYDTDQTDNDNTVITLREAIFRANQDVIADTIDFAANLNGATITLGKDASGVTINPSPGELAITESVTIDATMLPNGITIDASGNDSLTPTVDDGLGSRIFDIDLDVFGSVSKEVLLKGLTLTGADSNSAGGAIRFSGSSTASAFATLTIENSLITDNHARNAGGGAVWAGGGGILNITNSTILDNRTVLGMGGGVFLTSSNNEITNAKITDTEFINNEAAHRGGGLYIDGNHQN